MAIKKAEKTIDLFNDPNIMPGKPSAAYTANRSANVRRGLLQDAMKATLVGAGVGGAGRGLLGLYNLVRRNMSSPSLASATPLVINVPTNREDTEKVAEDSWWDSVKQFPDTAVNALQGDYATQAAGHPLWPLVPVGAVAGLGAGWKLSDMILDKQRKATRKALLEKKKQEYTEALSKQSALGQDLDRLYDQYEKQANTWSDLPGGLMGLYLLTAALTGTGAGIMGYNLAKKKQPNPALNAAIAKHRKTLGAQPSRITAIPQAKAPTLMQEEAETDDLNALSM